MRLWISPCTRYAAVLPVLVLAMSNRQLNWSMGFSLLRPVRIKKVTWKYLCLHEFNGCLGHLQCWQGNLRTRRPMYLLALGVFVGNLKAVNESKTTIVFE